MPDTSVPPLSSSTSWSARATHRHRNVCSITRTIPRRNKAVHGVPSSWEIPRLLRGQAPCTHKVPQRCGGVPRLHLHHGPVDQVAGATRHQGCQRQVNRAGLLQPLVPLLHPDPRPQGVKVDVGLAEREPVDFSGLTTNLSRQVARHLGNGSQIGIPELQCDVVSCPIRGGQGLPALGPRPGTHDVRQAGDGTGQFTSGSSQARGPHSPAQAVSSSHELGQGAVATVRSGSRSNKSKASRMGADQRGKALTLRGCQVSGSVSTPTSNPECRRDRGGETGRRLPRTALDLVEQAVRVGQLVGELPLGEVS